VAGLNRVLGMTSALSERARRAFLQACTLDVAVRKPGNVSADSPGHGMQASQFIASAEAAAAPLFSSGASVGTRIEGAVAATFAVAGCNTNLGIVLLCAPLARLVDQEPRLPDDPAAWRAGLTRVLAALDVDDAAAAYRAISAAQPGGLGRSDTQDVREAPTVTLLQAMQIAAPRDRVARQYENHFADLFDIGLPALKSAGLSVQDRSVSTSAVQALYLAFLGRFPDSHIVRKHGAALAQDVTNEARLWLSRAESGKIVADDPAFAAWDASLKARKLNPGTSADLTVASLCLAGSIGLIPIATLS
jgi:triphosphoribosyl-dephospho-CoA synthase